MEKSDDSDIGEVWYTAVREGSEKTIAISYQVEDRWWPQAAKQKGDEIQASVFCVMHVGRAQLLEASLPEAGTVLRLGRFGWSMAK